MSRTEVDAVTAKLPKRLRSAVLLWATGGDYSEFLSTSRRGYYRDQQLLRTAGLDLSTPHPAPFGKEAPAEVTYWSCRVHGLGHIPRHLVAVDGKGELGLSATGRLAGVGKIALLASKQLADAMVEHCLPRLRKRFGRDVECWNEPCTHAVSRGLRQQIEGDSSVARAFLERYEQSHQQGIPTN